jgi:hypothetical protein
MGYGLYRFENNSYTYSDPSITGDTIFECASLTKIITSYIAFKYVISGRIELNKSIFEYLTENELNMMNIHLDRNPDYRNILVGMLFSHTSGLPDRGGILYTHLKFTPGTQFEYSGEGFYILQKIIEKIEKKPIEKIFKKYFELPNCSYKYEDEFEENMAKPYVDMRNPHGAQSFYSSLPSLASIMMTIVNDEIIFPMMRTVQLNVFHNVSTGLGPFIYNNEIIWQWGDKNNFKNFLYYNYRTRKGFISLTNTENGWNYIKPEINNNVLNFLRRIYRNVHYI